MGPDVPQPGDSGVLPRVSDHTAEHAIERVGELYAP